MKNTLSKLLLAGTIYLATVLTSGCSYNLNQRYDKPRKQIGLVCPDGKCERTEKQLTPEDKAALPATQKYIEAFIENRNRYRKQPLIIY